MFETITSTFHLLEFGMCTLYKSETAKIQSKDKTNV